MGQKGKWENRDEKGRGTEKRQGERGRQGRRENNKLGEIERDREAGWESNHTLKADHCQPEEEETQHQVGREGEGQEEQRGSFM